MLRKRLEGDGLRGRRENGTIAHDVLRWLAGGSIYEVLDGPHVARSTAYS